MLQENDYMSLERGITYPHLNYTFPLFELYNIYPCIFRKVMTKIVHRKISLHHFHAQSIFTLSLTVTGI